MRILSIRGGGIKGLVPAMILDEFEDMARAPLAELFDLIVGTSTGGIIAVAAGLGMPAWTMRSLYVNQGPSIFRRRWLLGLFAPRYSLANLRANLEAQFHDNMLGDCQTKVMVTATNWDTSGAMFFKSWQHGFLRAADVASATAAAPTYFDPVTIPASDQFAGGRFVDGGLFANNPAPYAIIEAIKSGFAIDQIKLVDLACPDEPPTGRRSGGGGVVGVLPNIVDCLIEAGVDAASHAAKKILNGNCLQLAPALHGASRNMADASDHNLLRLHEAGERQSLDMARTMAQFLNL